ncbi:unnamed protein product, partial [Closterium sp. NIES-54]
MSVLARGASPAAMFHAAFSARRGVATAYSARSPAQTSLPPSALPPSPLAPRSDAHARRARLIITATAAAADGREGSTSPQEAARDAADSTRRGRQRRRTKLGGGSPRSSNLGSPQSSGGSSGGNPASRGEWQGGMEANGGGILGGGESAGMGGERRVGMRGEGSAGMGGSGGGGRRIGGGGAEGMSAARQRRLEKTREAREQRKESAEEEFQQWASQVASQDPELMELFGDAMLDPQQMQEKMEERIRSKQAELLAEKLGSGATMQVAIKEIDPFDMYIWFELHKTPSEDDMNTLGSVIRAWYVVGKLGGYNSANLQ